VLVGCGTVGSGVVRLWRTPTHAPAAALSTVAVRDVTRPRAVDLSGLELTADALAAVRDPRVSVVIEATSDADLGLALATAALSRGASFVTASKRLAAVHGEELEAIAAGTGASFRYEAAVGGVLPVVALLRLGLSPGPVAGFEAVLNGTCNFVLSRVGEGATFDAALRAAERAGFAEADSSRDTSGADTAEKLAILARLCGSSLRPDTIPTRGILGLDTADVQFGRAHGWSLKLLARFVAGAQATADVSPTFVDAASLLAQARDEENAVVLEGGAVGRVALLGAGAGSLPTAAALLADVRDVLRPVPSARAIPALPTPLTPDAGLHVHYLRVKVPFGARSASREVLAALAAVGVGTELVAGYRPGGAQVLTRPAPMALVRRTLATLRACDVAHVVVRDDRAPAPQAAFPEAAIAGYEPRQRNSAAWPSSSASAAPAAPAGSPSTSR
jgi:homoserine dehydrogenase